MSRPPHRFSHAWLTLLLTIAALAVPTVVTHAATPSAAPRTVAHAAPRVTTANPISGRSWGNYQSKYDYLWADWRWGRMSASTRALVGSIARQPRARWFGSWTADSDIADQLTEYIHTAQMGDPSRLVQMAFFRLEPWEGAVCHSGPSAAQMASYKRWMTNASGAVGNAHVALIMQPDLPFAMCARNPSVPLGLVSWAVQLFHNNNPNTAVYLDAGAYDWRSVAVTSSMLRMAGVRYARGFALNATHFDSTRNEVWFGGQLVSSLARAGIGNMHFVVNTDQNLRPFKAGQVTPAYFNNIKPCATARARFCSAVGIPPTTFVSSGAWGLPLRTRVWAREYVDAFMWFGRPWNNPKPSPHYEHDYAVNLGRWRGYVKYYPSPAPRA